ncbi:Guanine nucleotide-binding protein negative regulator 1 [Tolypocladium paradoxum]|uniref:Guanine nucleotide-binding protein negative regulator 1 n=1 Tax=Tolypocladium paradoxum TaxID=94208 RepID=A0A2S4KZJ2_9HYPO|nr:Guanine nucleotide-binding protein negative regulator 1 [Tolypocladium paradoxum]
MDSPGTAARAPDAAHHEPQHEGQQKQPEMKLLAHRPARSEAPLPPLDDDLQSAEAPRPFYSSAQWTADGTTIIVGASDNSVSSFVLPADLLQSADEDRRLEPQATTRLPEPTQAIAAAPFFSLAEASSQTYLVGCRDHPLHLYHVFAQDEHPNPVGAYRLVRKETEEYITPASLIWQYPGTHFLCGSANRLDYFDVSRHGSDGPVLTVPTIPSRRHISKGSGVGMKGTVAALGASPYDANGGSIVAAGTRTRWMGLYDLQRTDKVVANWSISHARDAEFDADLVGQGIVQVVWSPCGRYLVVNERHASSLLVYDIRGPGQLLSALSGRKSTTQQRLACDVFQGDMSGNTGFEVWAGTEDGSVLVWEDVGMHYGAAQPSWDWKAHDSPVGSVVLHSCGSVAATCSGGWEHAPDGVIDDDVGTGRGAYGGSRTLDESSLKVWSIGQG